MHDLYGDSLMIHLIPIIQHYHDASNSFYYSYLLLTDHNPESCYPFRQPPKLSAKLRRALQANDKATRAPHHKVIMGWMKPPPPTLSHYQHFFALGGGYNLGPPSLNFTRVLVHNIVASLGGGVAKLYRLNCLSLAMQHVWYVEVASERTSHRRR